MNQALFSPALNVIFYGPPGTGKTLHSIRQAVRIVEKLDEASFQQAYPLDKSPLLQQKFEQYQKEGKIALVTFHPSFSYEDFVEGLKPFKNEKDDLYYDIEDGIFKQICLNAAYSLYQHQQKRLLQNKEGSYKRNFEAIYYEFLDYLKRMMQDEAQEIVFETKSEKPLFLVDINKNDTLQFRYERGSRNYGVTKNSMAQLYRHFNSVEEIKHVNEDIQKVTGKSNASLYWSVFNRLKTFESTRNTTYNYLLSNRRLMGRPVNDELYQNMKREISSFDYQQLKEDDLKQAGNFVLIIDEINRANVPAVLGELITLLEPDKRAGQAHGLTTLLPYSRERFTVPPNLHILGSMNTADKSISTIDTALRRRFVFQEIRPQAALLNPEQWAAQDALQTEEKLSLAAERKGKYTRKQQAARAGRNDLPNIDLEKMLLMLNARLERLLDREHTIGHAYFIPVLLDQQPLLRLREVFVQQIIPLLQEYFFDDFNKIQMVIGKAFFTTPSEEDHFFFPEQETEFLGTDDNYNKKSYVLRPLSDEAFIRAIRGIYEKDQSSLHPDL
ncbi:AAA family ATPase [Catalinimonas niigatensis]|uniref:AAA family ATPase n=1 Tax=Catalinimonas niigatensis TaxID=1397264 RepID=UPI002665EBC9|nr:AAA family ATPase [Catalinimonas niigatensis]WPP51115.1 AAA family ATPase [Catalinimonas niigatensis]